jgi:glycosyltransferase involved in cell wall biosynthesis
MARFLFYDDKLINLMLRDEKPCGGAAVQTYGWIRGLLEEGQEVYVMTDVPPGRDNRSLKEECCHIKLIPMYEIRRGVRWLRWIYYRLPYTYKKIKAVKPDYLYVSIPFWTSALIGIICKLLKIKFIQRISNDNQLDKRFRENYSAVHQFFLNLGLRLSHHILCQNDFQLQVIMKKFPGKSAIKITNPIYVKDHDLLNAVCSRRYIAWLGIYRRQKNLKLLYQAASLLKREQFVIAGKEGANCDEETRYYLEKLKQLPNVKFIGYLERTQILPFLANARFLLNTSHHEGFSNTFLEAWSVGTPVLSSVHVNPDSIISKYELGIIYNGVFDLCKQYASMTSELYQLQSRSAREYVARYHGYRALTGKLIRYLSANDNIITGRDHLRQPRIDHTLHEQFQEHGSE